MSIYDDLASERRLRQQQRDLTVLAQSQRDDLRQRIQMLHRRAYAGHGPDTGQDTGAYCVHCSYLKQEYENWPCHTIQCLGG